MPMVSPLPARCGTITSDALLVNLVITSRKKDITMSRFSATYRDPTGRLMRASDAAGLTDLEKDPNTRVFILFKKGKPGGTVKLPISDVNFNTNLDVNIPGRLRRLALTDSGADAWAEQSYRRP